MGRIRNVIIEHENELEDLTHERSKEVALELLNYEIQQQLTSIFDDFKHIQSRVSMLEKQHEDNSKQYVSTQTFYSILCIIIVIIAIYWKEN
jgi:hypothetical protein